MIMILPLLTTICNYFIIGGSNNISILPEPGQIYYKNINIPLIGNQQVETEIITKNYANIKLIGLINQDGYIQYLYDKNKYVFKISHNLKELIKKYNIQIEQLYYNIENDTIDINVNIKLINYKSLVQLDRIV